MLVHSFTTEFGLLVLLFFKIHFYFGIVCIYRKVAKILESSHILLTQLPLSAFVQ